MKTPDRTSWDGIIVTDEGVCFGKPRIVGTRIYVDLILEHFEAGGTTEGFLEAYPHISRAQIKAAIGFARDLVAAKRNRLKGEVSNG